MTVSFARSLTAAVILSSALVALPALADTPASAKPGAPSVADAALGSRAAARRAARPNAGAPQRIVVADGSAVVRTRYSILVILGVGY